MQRPAAVAQRQLPVAVASGFEAHADRKKTKLA
jgi:hypothetical protein